MEINFEGKNILVSGAAGHLGEQLVKDYCQSGAATLLLIDSPEHEKDLKKIEKEYEGRTRVKTYIADFRNIEEIIKVVNQIADEGIVVDVLINNAGINIMKKANEMDEEIWDCVVDVNLKGSFFLTKEIGYKSLISQKGNVVFISSSME